MAEGITLKEAMMHMPAISVIMPCFNAATMLRISVESVLAQSMTDFELLIVDDGSKDDSVAAAQELAAQDRRVRIVCQANAGAAKARNRGIAQSRGRVLAFLEAGDRWMPTLLARHMAQLRENRLCGVSFARVRFFDPSLTWAGRVSASFASLTSMDVLSENPICTTSNLVARREVFEEIGGFGSDLANGDEQEWVARVLASALWQVRGLPDVLVHDRGSSGGSAAAALFTAMVDLVRFPDMQASVAS